jgi:hypothetical protein
MSDLVTRAANVELKALFGGQMLAIRSSPQGGQVVLSELAARALTLCRGFRTIELHEARLSRELRQPADAIRGILAELRRHELLEEQSAWLSRFGVNAVPVTTAISTVGVVTCQNEGRWPTLDRCLRSIASNAREWGRASGLRILVADDADSPAIREAVRARLATWRREYPEIGLQYFGFEEKLALLSGAGAGLRFLLTGTTSDVALPHGAISTGANRNILSHAAGRVPMICVDDDVHWNGFYRAKEEFQPGLRLHSKVSFDEPMLFFDNPAGRLKSDPCDLLAEAARPFGPLPSSWIDWSTTELEPSDWNSLESGNAGVRVAQIGLAGDSGGASPILNLMHIGRVAASLTEEQYRKLVLSRMELRAASQWSASPARTVMSYCLALDNRLGTLPPFAPLGRNQDGVFGGLVRAVDRAAFTAFAPVAICHEPPEERGYAPDALYTLPPMLLADIVQMLVEMLSVKVFGGSCAAQGGLARLGEWLETIADAPPIEYERLIVRLRMTSLERFLQVLEDTLKLHGSKPGFWVRDMQKLLRVIESHLASPQVGEVQERGTVWDCNAQQQYLRSFAHGLKEWRVL